MQQWKFLNIEYSLSQLQSVLQCNQLKQFTISTAGYKGGAGKSGVQ